MESSAATSGAIGSGFKFRLMQFINLNVMADFFVVTAILIVLSWPLKPSPWDLGVAFAFYLITGFGITIGFHRYLTHRSFKTSKLMRNIFAYMGSGAIEGPVITWVANHNKHHAFSDEDGDPHSPHAGHDGIFKGLWHAHMGWLLRTPPASKKRFAKELINDPSIVLVDRLFPVIALASLFAIPFAIGWAINGNLHGALRMMFWAGLARMTITHHITWSINSICHMFGKREFETEDYSTNVSWLALPTLGESWHHNHHAFRRSAFHGLQRKQIDPSGLVIRVLEKCGLVRDVVRISPEEMKAKLADQST